jgi:hypothetical protein
MVKWKDSKKLSGIFSLEVLLGEFFEKKMGL